MASSLGGAVQGCLRSTALCLAPARRSPARPAPAKGSGPRTRLNFLQQVVKKSLDAPNTNSVLSHAEKAGVAASPSPPSSPSSSPAIVADGNEKPRAERKRTRDDARIPHSAFTRYPVMPADAKKQPQGSTLLYKDEACIIVNDAFPKSTVHCLVMPTDLNLLSLNDLERKHVALLEHFVDVGNQYAQFLKEAAPKQYARRRFITGFHALPSLPMLHMHLVSLDLDSPCLKTKKHYNSFATFFFLTSDRVVADLKQNGYITLNQDVKRLLAMEEQPMKCQWCGEPIGNMPELKRHLGPCKSNQSLIA